MKMTKTPRTAGGPSSSIGIMRFFDTDTAGPKLTPEFVLVLTGIVIVMFVAFHLFA